MTDRETNTLAARGLEELRVNFVVERKFIRDLNITSSVKISLVLYVWYICIMLSRLGKMGSTIQIILQTDIIYTCCAWAGETFFPVVLLCQLFGFGSHYRFSKITRPFYASRNWWIIIVFLQSNSLTIRIVPQKYRELLQPYSHDRFSKISRTFCASRISE